MVINKGAPITSKSAKVVSRNEAYFKNWISVIPETTNEQENKRVRELLIKLGNLRWEDRTYLIPDDDINLFWELFNIVLIKGKEKEMSSRNLDSPSDPAFVFYEGLLALLSGLESLPKSKRMSSNDLAFLDMWYPEASKSHKDRIDKYSTKMVTAIGLENCRSATHPKGKPIDQVESIILQTRSSDEPLTTKNRCTICGARWTSS